MSGAEGGRDYILGLDLGEESLGWVVLDLDQRDRPSGIRAIGVRSFDSAATSINDIERGLEKTRNSERRKARLLRRQNRRRAGRHAKVFRLLQEAGLLPGPVAQTGQDRHAILLALDAELAASHSPSGDRMAGHTLMYRLRALALDKPLQPFELGRAFYHLCQRRGFQSNLKAKSPDDSDEKKGKVRPAINELHAKIKASGKKTLGAYLAGLDPEDARNRIRDRYTHRSMYKAEFEAIWRAQAPHHEVLTDELKHRLDRAMFRQRSIKSQRHLIGKCEVLPRRRRAPMAILDAQRFRYLQKVNDLRVIHPLRENPELTPDERDDLITALETNETLSFADMKKELGLTRRPQKVAYKFNLEVEGERKLLGNRTNATMLEALGSRWEKLSPEEQAALVDEILSFQRGEALARRLQKAWGLRKDEADHVARLAEDLDSHYCRFSRQALRQLLPELERGVPLATAIKNVFHQEPPRTKVHELLPPVCSVFPDLRNPIVTRGLTELRRVVNALIRRYGKPKIIRLELARNLKRGKRIREKTKRRNDRNRDEKARAIRRILDEMPERGGREPTPTEILKVRLAEECRWTCPYSYPAKQICMRTLLGDPPEFEIEHIIPMSRSLDNSFANKTLCHVKANREKANRTPFEAFSHDTGRWREILARVRGFQGPFATEKLRRFQMEHVPNDFGGRQLNDTAYMSRRAARYLGHLYGGEVDKDGKRRVQAVPGRVTYLLRCEWQLDGILNSDKIRDAIPNPDGGKNRFDHRHHAVDALVVALSSEGTIQMLSRSAQRAEEQGTRLVVGVEAPWSDYWSHTFDAVSKINVSRRVNRRVKGCLHEDTLYTRPRESRDEKGRLDRSQHVPVPLSKITTEKQIKDIVNKEIRDLVREAFRKSAPRPNRPFSVAANLPVLEHVEKRGDRRTVPIRRVRVRRRVTTVTIGQGARQRFVKPGANHHTEIVAVFDEEGNEVSWDDHPVQLLEAMERAKRGKGSRGAGSATRVVQTDRPGFKFSLSNGEYVEMAYNGGPRRLYRVYGISKGDIEFRLHNDNRPQTTKGKQTGCRVRCSGSNLFQYKARKVAVDPLGNILPAND